MKCYLYDKCKTEHEKANPLVTGQLYFVGKLFKAPICGHCVIRFQQLIEPTPTDGSVIEMQKFRQQHPEYAAVVDELGLDKVRFELNLRNIVEANPSSEPTHWSQVADYPPVKPKITVD